MQTFCNSYNSYVYFFSLVLLHKKLNVDQQTKNCKSGPLFKENFHFLNKTYYYSCYMLFIFKILITFVKKSYVYQNVSIM
jgi:hypothetical protein